MLFRNKNYTSLCIAIVGLYYVFFAYKEIISDYLRIASIVVMTIATILVMLERANVRGENLVLSNLKGKEVISFKNIESLILKQSDDGFLGRKRKTPRLFYFLKMKNREDMIKISMSLVNRNKETIIDYLADTKGIKCINQTTIL